MEKNTGFIQTIEETDPNRARQTDKLISQLKDEDIHVGESVPRCPR